MNKNNSLKLKFKSLAHQEQAIKNISAVFRGAKFIASKYPQSNPYLDLNASSSLIESNIKAIRNRDKIEKGEVKVKADAQKYNFDGSEDEEIFNVERDTLNIDIWMETGTGKTFTFLETIYQLNYLYGLAKFVILVPSNPIRQGTLKNIEVTKEFFHRKYSQKQIEAFEYSAQAIKRFNRNSNGNISVLVMTHQSFSKKDNTIHKKNLEDGLFKSQSSMGELAELKPVIIIDEPHRFTGKKTLENMPSFKPQILFRFGATFRDDHKNLVYVLDSAAAFKQSLVKTITVKSVRQTGESEHKLIYKGTQGRGKEREAIIEYNPMTQYKKRVALSKGGNVGEELSVKALEGYIIFEIMEKEVRFTNGHTLPLNGIQDYSGLGNQKARIMLEETVATHFEREERLFMQNIKALSLIFIDSVKKYMLEDGNHGELANMFEHIYASKLKEYLQKNDLDPRYRKYLERTQDKISEVHHGYFAISKKMTDQADKIDLILRHKEKLLSHSEDLRFIFSMWALQEGWDNPNIFTLCKLAPSNSSITKLQQIGRGLRLAVKQTEGGFERLTYDEVSAADFKDINRLEVIVPDEEETFVRDIQREISDNSIQSTTSIITPEKLCEKGICENTFSASSLLQTLATFSLVELDMSTGEAKIISKNNLDEAIDKAIENGIIFNGEKLKDLFDNYLDLEEAAGTKNELSSIDVEINEKLWPTFKILWDDINRRSIYTFSINHDNLLAGIVDAINSTLDIEPTHIIITKTKQAEFEKSADSKTSIKEKTENNPFLSFHEFVKRIAFGTKLSFHSIVSIIKLIDEDKFKMLANDEVMAIEKINEICLRQIRREILDSLKFTIHDTKKGKTGLTDEKLNVLKSIKLVSMGTKQHIIQHDTVKNKSLTKDMIGYDSEFEKGIIEESNLDQINVFAKIPKIRIPIPGGQKYNPDFAYVVNKNSKDKGKVTYHLVLETKGYKNEDYLRGIEKFKIDVAQKFFDALDDNTRGDNTSQGKIRIAYKTLFDDKDGLVNTIGGLEEYFKNKLPNNSNK